MDDPTDIPHELETVGGFQLKRAHEYFIEWTDYTRDEAVDVWIEYESTPTGGPGWIVQWHRRDKRSGSYTDQGTLGYYGPREFEQALSEAVSWMRSRTTGRTDSMSGDFDFSGGSF